MTVPLPLHDPRTALTALYGQPAAEPAGVVHVAAVWRAPAGAYITLRCGEHTSTPGSAPVPTSDIDWFVLSAARARADAVITTGEILRVEPTVVHDLSGSIGAALSAWRRQELGRYQAPYLLVLTTGRDLPRAHPALRAWMRPLIYTGTDAAIALRDDRDIRAEVVGQDSPTLAGALTYLRTQLHCRTIVVEAGPSTSSALYQPAAPLVDELLLSVYEGEQLPTSAQGPEFISQTAITNALPRRTSCFQAGKWRFMRFTR